jgi:Na+/melibiose symporter-like transporter
MQNDEFKWWQMWAQGALMAGREFCYSVELVSVTPVVKMLGLPDEGTASVWIASPIFGLLLGPFIGSWSDRCTSRLGRRRPFIISLVLIAIVGMSLLTFAPTLNSLFGLNEGVALIIAIFGSQLMDWGLDSTETPLRAYTLDSISDKDDQISAFNIQTLLTGLGGAFGFVMAGTFGMEKRVELYYIALSFILISVSLTLFSFKERRFKATLVELNPENSGMLEDQTRKPIVSSSTRRKKNKTSISQSKSVKFDENMREFEQFQETSSPNQRKLKTQSENQIKTLEYRKPISLARGFVMTTTRWTSYSSNRLSSTNSMPAGLDKDDWSDSDYDLTEDEDETDSSNSNKIDGFQQLQAPLEKAESIEQIGTHSTPCLKNNTRLSYNNNRHLSNKDIRIELIDSGETGKKGKKKKKSEALTESVITPSNIIKSIFGIPRELGTLCAADLCTWVTLCTFLIYYTDVMADEVYHGDTNAERNSTEYLNYQNGFKIGCYGLVEYSICISLGSAIMEQFNLFEKFPIKFIFAAAYATVSIVCAFMYFYPSVKTILSLTWLAGIAFSVLYTVPMILLSKYHQSSIYTRKSLPGTKRSYGLDCAILVSQTYLGQLMMSIIVGPLISFFGTTLIIFMVSSTFSLIGFILSMSLVHYSVNNDVIQ